MVQSRHLGAAPLLVGVSLDLTWQSIQGFVTGAGFSVFVAVWFMVRHDKRLTELTEALIELRLVLSLMSGAQTASRRVGMGYTGGEGREKDS